MLNRVLNKALHSIGRELVSTEELKFLRNLDSAAILYSELTQSRRELVAPYMPHSKSQLAQDLFALAYTECAGTGFFVEFGATDGCSLSNTWLLEKKLGWTGILAEPAKTWHDELAKNRNCIIDKRCVAKASGQQYQFLEVSDCINGTPELSSVESYADNGDWASRIRLENSIRYDVETITLGDLLDYHNAPSEIQFLSLDTEGSELDILEAYDFKNRRIQAICVEHNYVSKVRLSIRSLLLSKGYTQVLERVSRWDDWYVIGG